MSQRSTDPGITFSRRLTSLTDQQINRMAEIVSFYFPDPEQMQKTIRTHLAQADSIRLAFDNDRIIGFSIASRYRMLTPFYPRKTNVLFQRMLYLDPGVLYRGLGLRLLSLTMRDLFGWWWPFRRLVAICRTQNPVVAKIMNMYNVAYPHNGQPLPPEIRQFAEGLLPMLGATSIDDRGRLIGTLSSFTGKDFTDIWNRVLHRRNSRFEELMLHSAFSKENGRIINSGAFVLMLAYAKPFRFLRYLYY